MERRDRRCRAGTDSTGYDVQTAEDVGVLHADPRGAVAAHRVADEAAALAGRVRAVVRIDVRHDIARDVVFEVAGRHRGGVHRSVVDCLRVRKDDDHLVCAFRERSFDRLRNVDLPGPLVGADRVAVQGVDDWIPSRLVRVVARRQEDDRITVDGVALQVALEGLPMNRDAFDDGRTRAWNHVGHVRLQLREERD